MAGLVTVAGSEYGLRPLNSLIQILLMIALSFPSLSRTTWHDDREDLCR
ncbi:unnamed protein product [Brassica oleracea var. botrytis]